MRKYEEFKKLMAKKEKAVKKTVKGMFIAEEKLQEQQKLYGRLASEGTSSQSSVAYGEMKELKDAYVEACVKAEAVKLALDNARKSDKINAMVNDIIMETGTRINNLQTEKSGVVLEWQENQKEQIEINQHLGDLYKQQEALLKEAREVASFKTRSTKNQHFKAIMNKLPNIGSLRINLGENLEKEHQEKTHQEKFLRMQKRANKGNETLKKTGKTEQVKLPDEELDELSDEL